jgi:hypothetical protein
MPVLWPAETPFTYSSWKMVCAAAEPAEARSATEPNVFILAFLSCRRDIGCEGKGIRMAARASHNEAFILRTYDRQDMLRRTTRVA